MTADAETASVARPEVAAVADNFVALMRTFSKARARILAAATQDVEWSAHMLLRCIAHNEGPMRASALAECVQSDPSTVSRQVAALVRDGYLERQADPADGRASLLAVTAQAAELITEHEKIRLDYFARMLEGWNDADLRRFAALLERFNGAYETANSEWINERIAQRSGRAGSTH